MSLDSDTQKALYYSLYQSLHNSIKQEMRSPNDEQMRSDLRKVRNVFIEISTHLGKFEQIDTVSLLYLGIEEFLTDEDLQGFLSSGEYPLIDKASFLLKERNKRK